MQVAVRTEDHELAKSLQTNLGDLVGRLDAKGYKTETWLPSAVHSSMESALASNTSSGQQQPGQHADSQPGREHPRQAHDQPRHRARWIAQLEQTMSSEESEPTHS